MTRFRISDYDIRQPEQAAWCVLVNEKQAQETAISMITRIAKRLARHDNWYEDVRKARAQVQPSGIRLWRPTSLSSGYAGIALFFGYLAAAEPGCGWERLARDYMSRASRATSDEPLRHCGLFGGSAGLAFALLCLAESRSEEHTSELQSHSDLVCRLLLEKKKKRGTGGYGCADM